jgi:predicted Zn-dependent peptidase
MSNSYRLLNIKGYNLLLIPYNNNTLTVRSTINTGFIDENKDNLGINHLLEHVLINGNNMCENDCIPYLNKKGIISNASTSFKKIEYFNSGLVNNTYDMIKFIITTTLSPLNIKQSIIDKEKKAIINELLIAKNSSMYDIDNLATNKFYKYFGEKNFYNYDLQLENLKKINKKELIEFYINNYNQILFTVIGNFNYIKIINLFNKLLPYNNIYKVKKINYNNCYTFDNSIYFIKNNNLSNTIFRFDFVCNLPTDLITRTYVHILSLYIKYIAYEKLRSNDNLIYGINIFYDFSYCGIKTSIIINVENNNAIKVYNKFINLIINSYFKIDINYIFGIINNLKYNYLNSTIDNIENFYKTQILNNIFNNKNYKIYNYNEYINILNNIKYDNLLKYNKILLNLKTCLIVYSRNEKLNI